MSDTHFAREPVQISGTVTVSLTGTGAVNVSQWGGTATTLGQKAMAASVPVVIASDQSSIPVTPAANSSVNVNQWGGVATTLGQKASASSVPVVIASDQSDVGVNIDKYGGTTTTLGQKVMASSIPVTIASDQTTLTTNIGSYGGAATSLGQKASSASIPVVVASDNSAELTTVIATNNSAANTAFTLTLAAPGAGLFQYITHIRIARVATAALAGTALLNITSTNLNGWQTLVGNAMAAGGTQIDIDEDYAIPMKAAAANTAVTIVLPAAGAAVTWTITVHYYNHA